jgi:hypothetical protein
MRGWFIRHLRGLLRRPASKSGAHQRPEIEAGDVDLIFRPKPLTSPTRSAREPPQGLFVRTDIAQRTRQGRIKASNPAKRSCRETLLGCAIGQSQISSQTRRQQLSSDG